LDPDGPACAVWARPAATERVTVLMGAFDPPTNAHVDVLCAAARSDGSAPVLCLTKVLLARPAGELLSREDRVALLVEIGQRLDAGVALANRGTYLDVGRALRANGIDVSFVVGADKVDQLADPVFYDDGVEGVRATFAELRFVVVPRVGAELTADLIGGLPPGDVRVLDPSDVFTDASTAGISGTDVRRILRAGGDVSTLVPPEVALALRSLRGRPPDPPGYTSAR
jgi:nicotinic acid mononucleotide adenylyltransferase